MIPLPPSVTAGEMVPGYPILRIQHPLATATIALHGGHLMEWTPAGQSPGIYLSPNAVYKMGKAIRGGIPVCWPWFGENPENPALPAHGFVRTRMWEWESCQESEDGVVVVAVMRDGPETVAIWPHAFELRMEWRIGRQLEAILTATNRGDEPVLVGGALHTYLACGDVTGVMVEGLDGVCYLDSVGGRMERRQAGPVVFGGEVDRVYHGVRRVEMVDSTWCRRIVVETAGARDVVVWNPWTEKTIRLGDLPESGYRDFICLEAARSSASRVLVEPGARDVLSSRVEIFASTDHE